MRSIVQEGRVPGILAYVDGRPVGWCSIAPRSEFPSLDRSALLKSVDEKPVWSIVCFFISKPFRGQAMSRRLVEAAIGYARTNGAEIVEAYPTRSTSHQSLAPERYMGVRSTFQKSGFQIAADRGGERLVMRYETRWTDLPALYRILPDLVDFGQDLAWDYQSGSLLADELHRKICEFYTPKMMNLIEKRIPGWIKMASYDRGQTLVHTTCMLLAMFASAEYAQRSDEEKRLLEWVAVLHDLGKQASPSQRDHAHAFRSAALAGRILPDLGFPVMPSYPSLIDSWYDMTSQAVVTKGDALLQDNSYLEKILDGIITLFGAQSPAARIVQCILLHMSLDTIPDEWPCPAGIDDDNARRLIDADLLPLLNAVMLADSDAWNLYNLPIKDRYRRKTHAYLERVWFEKRNIG